MNAIDLRAGIFHAMIEQIWEGMTDERLTR
jgi:hypothetical protein